MSQPAAVLVTGATGFVGRVLCRELQRSGHAVRGGARTVPHAHNGLAEWAAVGDIGGATDWRAALHGRDVVVHLAARVHVMRETAPNPLEEFRRANVAATEHLARSAAAAGVRRLVFVSTAKVNGEATLERPFRETDSPQPQDAYALSKWEAEQALERVSRETGLEVVVVRPPLVYGPGVGGNFLRLLRWVRRGVPLPLARVDNRRSMVFVGNLANALVACVEKAEAAGKTYLVCDGQALSTAELIKNLALRMNQSPRLWPCPPAWLKLAGRLLGKQAEVERLIGSLELDGGAIQRELAWQAPFTVRQGLEETVGWYMRRDGSD